jgi:hypothetical protein
MSAAKIALIGLAGVAAIAVVAGVASAAPAKKPASTIPPGFKPPANATIVQIPAGHAGIPFGLTQTSWPVAPDASGAKAGTYVLVQNASNPLVDWLVTFTPDDGSGARGIVAVSQTQNGGLMAQAAAAGL